MMLFNVRGCFACRAQKAGGKQSLRVKPLCRRRSTLLAIMNTLRSALAANKNYKYLNFINIEACPATGTDRRFWASLASESRACRQD